MSAAPPKAYPDEDWRDVPGYEGRYAVSSYGRLYSKPRRIEKIHPTHGTRFSVWWCGGIRVLRPDSYGYPCAYFGRLPGPLPNGIQIHTVVALVFLGPRPKGMDVRHKNSNVKDNRASNLEYGTRTQNILDARRTGKPWKKLTIEQAREIRALKTWGFSNVVLGKAFGVGGSAISQIVRDKNLKEAHEYP